MLDSAYGRADNKEQLFAEFYSTRQRDDENVTTWSNRLQDILGKGEGSCGLRRYELHASCYVVERSTIGT